jgi:hypothetical protein
VHHKIPTLPDPATTIPHTEHQIVSTTNPLIHAAADGICVHRLLAAEKIPANVFVTMNTPSSSSSTITMASHINNIRDEWNLNSALDALPGRLSPNHQHDAMAWGEPFLGYLSTLAFLTPGNLPEVQDRLNSRIDLGRRFGLGARENWAVQDDLVALIRQYGVALARQEGHSPRAKAQFVKAEEATPVCKSEETSPEYTKENPRRSGRERKPVVGNGSFAGMAEDDSSSAVFTPTRSAKRKRGQNREEDTGAAPVRVKRARRRARRDCSPALSLPDARDVPSTVVEDNGRVQADNDEVQQGQVGVQEEVLAIDEHFPKQEDVDQGHVNAQEEVSATVWALGYITQVPSHLSLTPG